MSIITKIPAPSTGAAERLLAIRRSGRAWLWVVVFSTTAWFSTAIRAESPGTIRESPAPSPAPGNVKPGESASPNNDAAADNSPPYRAPVETDSTTESKESTISSAKDKPSDSKEAVTSEARTPTEKAIDTLNDQLKEMQSKVDFPVGKANNLLAKNRAAYDRQDLPALAESLLSRKQLYGIAIWKSKHRLAIFDQRGVLLIQFDVGIGGDTEGGLKAKRLEMDGRTPEGIYRIFRFYSLDADKKSESYTELERLNGYYLTAKLGYGLFGKPGKDAGKNVFGPRFYGIDYPASSDASIYLEALRKGQIPTDKKGNFAKIGSGIAIHGTNDEPSVGKTFGSGCIRLRNEEIVKLDPFMSPGMPVVIFP